MGPDLNRVAVDYMREAYYLNMQWGAKIKVLQLHSRLPLRSESNASLSGLTLSSSLKLSNSNLSNGGPETESSDGAGVKSSSSSSSPYATTLSAVGDYLDLMTVIKNSQALFSEVETDKLLGKLMSGVIENTGAERCVLLLKRQDRFLVEATGGFSMKEQQLEISTSLGLELDKVPLPRTVINYVTTKQDTIHFDDVPQTEPWSNDPFITSAQPRSLVCTPIVHMGKMLGVLYLENSSVVAVFSKSRFWLISIICAQVLFFLLWLSVVFPKKPRRVRP